jgi:hypothetical protein
MSKRVSTKGTAPKAEGKPAKIKRGKEGIDSLKKVTEEDLEKIAGGAVTPQVLWPWH